MQHVVYCDGGTSMPVILLVLEKVVSTQPKGARRNLCCGTTFIQQLQEASSLQGRHSNLSVKRKGCCRVLCSSQNVFPNVHIHKPHQQTELRTYTAFRKYSKWSAPISKETWAVIFFSFRFQSKQKLHGRQTKVMEALVQLDGGNTVNRK